MPSPSRRPWPMLASVVVFSAAVIAVPLTCQFRRSQRPQTIASVAGRLRAKGISFRMMPTSKADQSTDNSVYLVREDYRGDPRSLNRYVSDWTGVVLLQFIGTQTTIGDESLLYFPPFVFFGDPAMLEEIRLALD